MVPILEELETYASIHHIPIMQQDGIAFLEQYIKEHHVKSILEIGSAIGYSAIRMALLSQDIHVDTVERDEIRYQEAVKNIQKAGLEDQITIYLKDAFDLQVESSYDLIFIDAAKSQYIKFFEKFKTNLKPDGTIISDNLAFHGLVQASEVEEENLSRNVRGLVRKLRKYITFLEENEEFETTFLNVGDGIGVTVRKK